MHCVTPMQKPDDPNARPTIGERYNIAVGNGSGQERMILAAGMQHERLGAVLLRLQAEYDIVREELERAGQIAPQRTEQARELARLATLAERLKDYGAAAALKDRAIELRARAAGEVLSARAFILMGMKTLHNAKQQWGAFAIGLAAQPKRGVRADAALKLAGRVLDVWLDPICHTCDGTGTVGNRYAGENERQCSACLGSGHRRDVLGNRPSERKFAGDLLAELQRRVASAAGGIKRSLGEPGPAEDTSEAQHGMQGRLADMRSAAAQTD